MIQFTRPGALNALARYNRAEVMALDRRARNTFFCGLGSSDGVVASQVAFLANEYGAWGPGTASRPLVETLGSALMADRESILNSLEACPAFDRDDSHDAHRARAFDAIFGCFASTTPADPFRNHRCTTKLLHLLRPDAFPIHDRWIGAALDVIPNPASASLSYRYFFQALRSFTASHETIMQAVFAADRGKGWSRLKTIDKILLCRRYAAGTATELTFHGSAAV